MANQFFPSPLDSAISEAEKRRDAARSAVEGIGVPDSSPRRGGISTTLRAGPGTLEIPYQEMFEAAAREYRVPVNVLVALAEQESTFNERAFNPETGASGIMQYIPSTAKALGIDPNDPAQAISAAAKQYAERIAAGMSHEDAIKEHFAGPNRNLWGPKTDQYGKDVLARAKKYGLMYQQRAQQRSADEQAKQAGAVDPRNVAGTPENAAVARQSALEKKAGEERGWGDATKDALKNMAEGVNNLLGAPVSLFAPDSTAADFFNKNARYWQSQQSDVLKARMQLADQKMKAAGEDGFISQVVVAATEYTSDPALAARLIFTTLPSLIPGVAAAKIAQAAALARGATAAKAAAVATGAAAGTNAALNAGGARGSSYEDIKQTLLEQGVPEDKANEIALEGSKLPAIVGGVAGAVSGGTGLEKVIAGGAKGGARAAVGAALAEVGGEQFEEVAPQAATNLMASKIDNRPLSQDLGRTVVETGIGAAPGAVAAGGGAYLQPSGSQPPEGEGGGETQAPPAGGVAPDITPAQEAAAAGLADEQASAGITPASEAAQGGTAAQAAQPPAAAAPAGPLGRALEKGRAAASPVPGDAVDQSDLDQVLDRAIAEGSAQQIDLNGNKVASIADVPDSVLAEFPAMPTADSGLIPIHVFTSAEQEALRRAGIVENGLLESGEEHEGVDPNNLWPERQRRQEEAKNNRKGVSEEEKAAGREKRASVYDRLAAEQEALGELGNTDAARSYREKAAEIRAGGNPKQTAPAASSPVPATPAAAATEPSVSTQSSDEAFAEWWRNNRSSAQQELIAGGIDDANTYRSLPDDVRSRSAHGMAKHLGSALANLRELLTNGVDRNRGRNGASGNGSLDTAPLASGQAAGGGMGTGSGNAYSDGAFTLVTRQGVGAITDISQVEAVVVNSALPDSLVDALRAEFPSMRFMRAGELYNLSSAQTSQAPAATTAAAQAAVGIDTGTENIDFREERKRALDEKAKAADQKAASFGEGDAAMKITATRNADGTYNVESEYLIQTQGRERPIPGGSGHNMLPAANADEAIEKFKDRLIEERKKQAAENARKAENARAKNRPELVAEFERAASLAQAQLDALTGKAPAVEQKKAPGDKLENGFRQGPVEGEKYRVSDISGTGGVALEKRLPAGTFATFYVGKDGGFVDADGVNLIGSGAEKIWKPEDDAQRDAAKKILEEMGALALTDARRKDLKKQLKDLVTGNASAEGGRATAPTAEPRKPIAGKPVKEDVAVTPAGREVGVEYRVVEAADLVTSNDDAGNVNPAYPQSLQPRDRTRAASELQVTDIANNINPRLLGESPTTSDGAPVVSPEGVVESGNGRTLALKRAYARNPESAERYRQHLRDMGVDIDDMKQPVLVRVRKTPMSDQELVDYTRESNERTTLAMGASERAKADAQFIPPIIGDYRGGDLTDAGNRDFVRKFMQGAVSKADQGNMVDPSGALTQEGRRRIEAAILSAAYGDGALVADLFESADSDIKTIAGALLDAAPRWAAMRSNAEALADGVDITGNLMEAVNIVRRARKEDKRVAEIVANGDMFAGAVDQVTQDMLRIFFRGDAMAKGRSRKDIGDSLSFYADQAMQTKAGSGLFGDDLPPVTNNDLLRQTNERLAQGERQQASQQDIFGARTRADDEGAGAPGGENRGPQPAAGSEPAAEARSAEGLTEDQAKQVKAAALERAKGVLTDDEAADIEETAQEQADNIVDFWTISARMLDEAVAAKKAKEPEKSAKTEPSTTPDGERIYTKGVASMQAAKRTKDTGQPHAPFQVDGGWVVRPAGQKAEPEQRAGDRRQATAASPAMERRQHDRRIMRSGDQLIHDYIYDKLIKDGTSEKDIKHAQDAVAHMLFDSVTGWAEARTGTTKVDAMQEAQRAVAEGHIPVFFVSMDIQNLGGLNAFHNNVEDDANVDFRRIADILREELEALGKGTLFMRTGGDEIGAFVQGASEQEIAGAMARAKDRVKAYAKERGFADIPHAKKPDIKPNGVGVHFGLAEVRIGTPGAEVYAEANRKLKAAEESNNVKQQPASGRAEGDAGREGEADRTAENRAGEAAGGEVRQAEEGRQGEPRGVTGDREVSLSGKSPGDVLRAEDGSLFRVVGADTKSGLIKLVRDPDQLSERTVFKDQKGFDRLVIEDQEAKAADARGAQRNGADSASQAPSDLEGRFANNKIFTADKVAAARARIKNKLNGSQLNSGFDPELLTDGMTIAGAYIEEGVRDFAAFAKQMTADFGDTIKPFLLSFWEGARNYPGLNTDGMTDTAEAARLHKELMAEGQVTPAAAEAIGKPAPKAPRKPKTGKGGDKTLTDDWGVDSIDAYTDEGERIKAEFLKEARGYLRAVADILLENGFEPVGSKPVNVNEAGIAVSGDVSLHMSKGKVGVYASIGVGSLRGVAPTSTSGVQVMYRAAGGGKSALGHGMNRWAETNLSAAQLADLMMAEAASVAAQQESTREPRQLGQQGPGALEGTPAQGVQGAAAQGPAGEGAARGGRADAQGNERAGSRGDDGARGLGNGPREVPVQAGGDAGAGSGPARPAADAGDAEGAERGDGSRVGAGDRVASLPAQDRADDFSITDKDGIGEGGAKTKFNNNMAAIRLLKELQAQGRAATRQEQAILAKYVGWGGLPQAFYREGGGVSSGWEKQAAELKDALTPEEYSAAAASTKDAHYTSPEIVAGIWKAVEQFGFRAGRVLEPSVGVGNFFGLMPKDARAASQLVGVELDAITGGIAKMLYPAANVQSPVGFQDFATPSNYFDLAIGNPPFGATKIYDGKRRDLNGLSIHNYFFAKSIDALKPGGVLGMVVTNRFMDAYDQRARKQITDKTELLGAIRLPNNAFLKNAGTEVTTDIIFLRKLPEGETGNGESWMEVRDYTDKDGNTVPLNEYFHRHPEMMLGEFGAYGTMYRAGESALVARDGQNTGKLLAEAIGRLPRDIMEADQAAPAAAEMVQPGADISAVKVGSMYIDGGKVMVRLEDELGEQRGQPVDFPNEKARERVIGMIGVRDALTDLRRLQLSSSSSDAQIERARADLNVAYDKFVKEFGPVNVDANKRVFRDDPSWPQLSALEDDFDKGVSATVAAKTGEQARKPSARKAAIFSKRTQSPYQPPTSAKTAKDALVASLAEVGRVDMAYMAELYGKTEEQMAKELAGLIYRNPVGGWETKDQYLSGNVKQKLAVAEEAAKQDAAYRENVEALREVQPADIETVDIDVKPGAHWLPEADMSAFADHIAGTPDSKAIYSAPNASWSFTLRPTAEASAMYGTDRVSVSEIVRAAANQKQVQVYDTLPDDRRVLNESATQAANEKVERVKAEFRRWIWQDEGRRVRLGRLYNDTFNTDRQREYDGAHLTFPGKIGDDIIRLRPHQANAVWRIIQSPTTLTDHVVGAGKTFTLIAAAMEMRRMGLASKPMFVVPNHLVGQWASDFVKLYPGANILAANKKDFEKENRKRLFSRIATGDWDAVIVAHSSFGKVGVTPKFEKQFILQQMQDIETSLTALRSAQGKDSRNVKQVEKMKAALEEKLKRLFDQDGKDDAIYFDELGVDALFVDEAHEFKNLQFSTSMQRVAGLGNPAGSQKAADLFMKVQQIQSRTGGRNIVFATGTPISNTMAEMYTMQRFLDYPTLKAQGLAHFDAWARMFGEVVTDWELSPSGQYKMNSRFAKFVNMPELMQRYGSFADVVNRDDINRMLAAQGKTLPVPKVKGGKPNNVVVERSGDQAAYIGVPRVTENGSEEYPKDSLIWRSENLPKKAEKGSDNMLKIMSDARKAALDMRLIDPSYPDNPASKVNNAADRIVDLYRKWAADKGAQLVFIDLSTPKAARGAEAARIRELIAKAGEGDQEAQDALDKMNPDDLLALESDFSVYDDLREKLIQRGIPADEIAFIHDATTEDKKEVLFGKVRSGRVRVMFGSTAKMGAGMNVQERLVALHHLDAPWRPSDLEQREGRIIRQGNVLRDRDPDNFEVEILRYATKQTLDSRMWQTIEAKARFIEQVRKGMAGSREIEDIGGEAANSAEMKAASSGNPLILEEMELRQKVRKLGNEATEHDREQYRIQDMIRSRRGMVERGERRMEQLAEDAKRVPAEFVVKVGKTSYDKPKELGAALLLKAAELGKTPGKDSLEVGSYGDFTLTMDKVYGDKFVLTAAAAGEYQVEIKGLDADPTGLAIRLKNTITQIPDQREIEAAAVERAREDIPKLEAQLKPWPKAEELAAAKARHQTIIDQLKPKKKEEPKKADDGSEGKASVGGKWYFSALERAAEGVKQETATAQQWAAMLSKAPGVKAEELDATGVIDWLNGLGGKVTKPQVLEFLAGNGVQVEEVTKGANVNIYEADASPTEARATGMNRGWFFDHDDERWGPFYTRELAERKAQGFFTGGTKYGKYQLPGGTNYRELLLTLPAREAQSHTYFVIGAFPGEFATREEAEEHVSRIISASELPGMEELANNIRRHPFQIETVKKSGGKDFSSSHWEETNVLAHIRFNERAGANGERILHIEEIQSDWHQEGRKNGYGSPMPWVVHDPDTNAVLSRHATLEDAEAALAAARESGGSRRLTTLMESRTDTVPDAPFKDTGAWSMLAMKRMIRYAVDNGFDAVTWTGGEEQAERYDLSKQVDSVRITRVGEDEFDVAAAVKGGGRGISETGLSLTRLEETVGKDLAKRAADLPQGVGETYTDADLKVGGEGMKGFYDRILPNETNKLLKKYGGKVEKIVAGVFDKKPWKVRGWNGEHIASYETEDKALEMATEEESVAYERGVEGSFLGFRITPALREMAASGLPLFSRQQQAPAGMQPAAASSAIEKAGYGALLKAGKVVVHKDSSEFPGKWRASGAQAVTMPDGTIHLSAADIEPDNLMPVLMHEAFHGGAEKLIGTGAWERMLAELGSLHRQAQRSGGKMGEFWKAAGERVKNAERVGGKMTEKVTAEEFGAYAIEEYEAAPPVVKRWVDSVLAKVKAWLLKRFGLQAGRVTPAQLRELAAMALRDSVRGGGPGGGIRASMKAITETPAFKRWFSGSKVVDAEGKPLVVYHGARMSGFSVFMRSGYGYIYSTSDSSYASSFGSGDTGSVYPLFLSIKNPLDAAAFVEKDIDGATFEKFLADNGVDISGLNIRARSTAPFWSWIKDDNLKYRLEDAGFDGIRMMENDWSENRGGSTVFVAFRPEQIKSVFNRGTFDQNNPDIRASVRRQRLDLPEQRRNRFAVPPETRGQRLQRIFQDRFNRVAIVQRVLGEQGGTVSEASNVYQAEERYHGRVAARVEDFAKQEIEPFIKAVADAGVTLDEVAEYAYAEHAPERNAYIASINDRFADGGGSGMTDEEAANVIATYKAEGKAEKLAALTAQLRDIAGGTRSLIVQEGLEPADRVQAWEDMFDNYVPLRGFEQVDEFGNEVPQGTGLGGKGFSVRGKETKAALGRGSRASQIIENIVAQRERTIMRAEKNRVAKALLRLVAENPDKQLWEINEVKQKPALVNNGKAAITDIFTDMPANEPVQEGKKVKYKPVRNQYGDEVVVAKVKGREVLISIKDPILAEQLHMRDARELPPLFSQLNQINRVLARLWTSLNPVFSVVNYARDIQTAAINAIGETNAKVAAQTVKYAAPGGWAMRATLDAMRNKDSEGSLWYERYRQAGGKTGFLTFGTLEDKTKELENMLRDARGDRSKAMKAAGKVVEYVEGLNALVENAVRLAAFRAAVENGMSTAQAASFAKNLTVNFNRRGEWAHFFGALYLFFNPAVQGTARLGRAMKSRKVQAAASGLVFGSYMLGMIAREMGGEDDDGEYYFDKIPSTIKDRNLIVMKPGTNGEYWKVPMPYGYSFFSSLGNAIYDVGHTDKSKVKVAADLADAFLMSFNPVGDGMPTVFTPAAQVAMNEDRFGRQIMPEQGKYELPVPDSQRYFPSMEGALPQRATSWANQATGGNEVRPGFIDVSPETVEHVYQFVTGGLGTAIKDIVKFGSQDDQDATILPFIKQVSGRPLQNAAVNRFYENATEAELAETEREMFIGRADEAALQAFDAEDGWKADLAGDAQKLRKRLAKLRAEARDVMADETMPREERVRIKRQLQDEMNLLATDFNKAWNEARRSKVDR